MSCHAAHPSNPAFKTAPAGVVFDSLASIRQHRTNIISQAVMSQAMPLGNATKMTPEERSALGQWLQQTAD